MKLLFDFAALGRNFVHGPKQVGIIRAAEMILNALASRQDVEVLPVASLHQSGSEAYARQLGFSGLYLSKWQIVASRLLFPWTIQKYLFGAIQNRSFLLRAARRFYLLAERALSGLLGRIARPVLDSADVYFSPWNELPKFPAHSRNLTKALFIHDLIVLLYPETFTKNMVCDTRRIYESISPDTLLICNSRCTQRDLIRLLNVSEDRTCVAYLGADERFTRVTDEIKIKSVREKYGLSGGPFLLAISTLEPRKNLSTLVHAFRLMVERFPDVPIDLVIGGAKGWKFAKLTEDLSEFVSPRVKFIGYVDDEDLPSLYSMCEAFVSLSRYEGFGLPLLEAMKCGAPVVASNCSSHPEVVGSAGILVDPDDPRAISLELGRLIGDGSRLARMRQMSMEQAGNFSWERCAESIIRFFASARAMASCAEVRRN